MTNSLQWLMLPKRAIDNPAMLEQVRHLLQAGIQGSTGAFPVLPLAAIDALPETDQK